MDAKICRKRNGRGSCLFDFDAFLRRERVDFITKGANVAKNHVNVHCPFCGADDPSHHLGINLDTGNWGCWRNHTHRGRKPHRLVRALLGCSWDKAAQIVGETTIVEEKTIGELLEEVRRPKDAGLAPLEEIDLDPSFRQVEFEGPHKSASRFGDYLHQRGFVNPPNVARFYGLRCCSTGLWKGRLIAPLTFRSRLIGWTGRTIEDSIPKYRSHPSGDAIKRILFNYDEAAEGGRFLVLTEGPFDAMKVDYYGQTSGVRAVGLLGVTTTPSQRALLGILSQRFDHVVILLDPDATLASIRLMGELAYLRPPPERFELPPGVKDPGDLDRRQVWMLCDELSKRHNYT